MSNPTPSAAEGVPSASTLEAADKDHFLGVIEKWLAYWMNQTQNSEADRANYFGRAFGVDANMRHHLAKLLAEDAKAHALASPEVLALVEALEEIKDHWPDPRYTFLAKIASDALAAFSGKPVELAGKGGK